MRILGVSSYFHDSSAALLVNGDLVAYVEEERFNRDKHTNAYPKRSIDWVLEEGGIALDDVDEVAFYVNPRNYVKTGLTALLANLPRSLALASGRAATMP